jgi:hypothetical protein
VQGAFAVRFVLYSDKTVSQCLSALNERIQAPAAANRPALSGWIEKGGRFSIGLKSVVLGTFTRTTHLEGTIERESGSSVIRGSVPDGVPPTAQIMILLGIIAVGILLIVQRNAILGVIAMIAAVGIYIPLRGDFENSDRLLMEVEKTLKADPKPPKSTATTTTAKKVTTTTTAAAPKKPTAPTTTAAKKTTTTTTAAAKKPAAPAVKKTTTTPAVGAKKPVTTR